MVRADGAVFDVFCEPGLGVKIKGRLWDRPFCIRNRKPPNSEPHQKKRTIDKSPLK